MTHPASRPFRQWQLPSDSVSLAERRCRCQLRAQQAMGVEEAGVAFLPDPVALATDVEDVAVVQQPVDDGRSYDGAAEEFAPLAESFVRR